MVKEERDLLLRRIEIYINSAQRHMTDLCYELNTAVKWFKELKEKEERQDDAEGTS